LKNEIFMFPKGETVFKDETRYYEYENVRNIFETDEMKLQSSQIRSRLKIKRYLDFDTCEEWEFEAHVAVRMDEVRARNEMKQQVESFKITLRRSVVIDISLSSGMPEEGLEIYAEQMNDEK
jgi:hypothetical protein